MLTKAKWMGALANAGFDSSVEGEYILEPIDAFAADTPSLRLQKWQIYLSDLEKQHHILNIDFNLERFEKSLSSNLQLSGSSLQLVTIAAAPAGGHTLVFSCDSVPGHATTSWSAHNQMDVLPPTQQVVVMVRLCWHGKGSSFGFSLVDWILLGSIKAEPLIHLRQEIIRSIHPNLGTVLQSDHSEETIFHGQGNLADWLKIILPQHVDPSITKALQLGLGMSNFATIQTDHQKMSAQFDTQPQASRPTFQTKIPLEILEARALIQECAVLDEPLLKSPSVEAFSEVLRQTLSEHHDVVFAARRIVFEGSPIRNKSSHLQAIDRLLLVEPENISAISLKCGHLYSTELADPRLLKLLSQLGRLMGERLLNTETTAIVTLVLAEMLGDAWGYSNPLKAQQCYLSILQRRPDDFMITYKLALAAAKAEDHLAERRYLLDAAQLSNDQDAQVHMRFQALLIAQKHSTDNKIDLVQEAFALLALNPKDPEILVHLSKVLAEHAHGEEAIEVLNQLTRNAKNISESTYAKAQLLLGQIWENAFQRSDIARLHFSKALEAAAHDVAVLAHLDKVYRQEDNPTMLVQVLELQYRNALQRKDKAAASACKNEIIEVYRDKLQDAAALTAFITRAAKWGGVDNQDIDHLSEWNHNELDWEEIYATLAPTASAHADQAEGMAIHLKMARIAETKLGDFERAAKHLEAANSIGVLDQDDFAKLKNHLTKRKANRRLFEALTARLKRCPDSERLELISAIMDSAETDLQAWIKYARLLSAIDVRLALSTIQKKLKDLAAEKDLDSIGAIATAFSKHLSEETQRLRVIDQALELVEKMTDKARFGLLDRLYRIRMDMSKDSISIARAAISALGSADDRTFLRHYARTLIEKDVLPDIADDMAKHIFGSSGIFYARYLSLCAKQSQDEKQRAHFASRAAEVFTSLPGNEPFVFENLVTVALNSAISDTEIDRLFGLALAENNNVLLAKVLKRQIDLSDQGHRREDLVLRLAQLEAIELNDLQAAERTLREAISAYEPSMRVVDHLMRLLRGQTLKPDDATMALRFLQSADIHSDTFYWLVPELMTYNSHKKAAIKILEDRHDKYKTAHEDALAERVEDLLALTDATDDEKLKLVIQRAVKNKELSRGIDFWVRLALRQTNYKKLSAICEWTKDAIVSVGNSLSLSDFLTRLLVDPSLAKLPPEQAAATYLKAGEELFEDEHHSKEAWSALLEAWKRDKKNSRTLVPLYLLSREFGQADVNLEILEHLISVATANPEALKQYPFTIEQLESDLLKLHKELGRVMTREATVTKARKVAGGSDVIYSTSISQSSSDEKRGKKATQNETSSVAATASRRSPQTSWRKHVNNNSVPLGFTQSLMDEAFQSALEKHVALQAAALMEGALSRLDHWQWRAWRKPLEISYSLSGRERYPSQEDEDPRLASALHKLVGYLTPALARYHRDRFGPAYLAKKTGIAEEKIAKSTKPIEWTDDVFKSTLINNTIQQLKDKKFQLLNLPGLRSQIFFDSSKRCLYTDLKYYSVLPEGIFHHRLSSVLWSIKLNYYVSLHLHPRDHVLNLLRELAPWVKEGSFSRIKMHLQASSEQRQLLNAIKHLDISELARHFEAAEKQINEATIVDLWTAKRERLYKLMIAETLDVVGIFEAIIGVDLVDNKKIRPGDIIRMSPHFFELLKFLTRLQF